MSQIHESAGPWSGNVMFALGCVVLDMKLTLSRAQSLERHGFRGQPCDLGPTG